MFHGDLTALTAVEATQVREQIQTLAAQHLERPEEFTDAVMELLTTIGVVAERHKVALLSPHGMLLCELARTPDATLRQVGYRLGWSEGWVQKAATKLVTGGLASRTRVGQRVTYKFARTELMNHPDTRRLGVLFGRLATNPTETEG